MTIDVTKYTNHEDFNTVTTDNDITIIELAQEVDLTTYTPACLPSQVNTTALNGKKALVVGNSHKTDYWSKLCSHWSSAQITAL